MTSALEWHDLLGIPWKLHGTSPAGMDCSTVAEEVWRRLGHDPPASSPFRADTSAGHCDEMATYLGQMEERFERIGSERGSARRVGDIVLVADDGGMGRHLYTRISERSDVFLTTSTKSGVIAVRGYVIKNVLGVYRIKEAAA